MQQLLAAPPKQPTAVAVVCADGSTPPCGRPPLPSSASPAAVATAASGSSGYVRPALLPAYCKAAATAGLDARVAAPGFESKSPAAHRNTRRPLSTAATAAAPPSAAAGDVFSGDLGFSATAQKATKDARGPRSIDFPVLRPSEAAPAGCDVTAWAQWRLWGAIEKMVAQVSRALGAAWWVGGWG